MPYDLRVELTDQMDFDSTDGGFTIQERNTLRVPTLCGEELQHSHAGNIDFGEGGYDADVDDDNDEINEVSLEEIVQKPKCVMPSFFVSALAKPCQGGMIIGCRQTGFRRMSTNGKPKWRPLLMCISNGQPPGNRGWRPHQKIHCGHFLLSHFKVSFIESHLNTWVPCVR
jgi:hypothetical protein